MALCSKPASADWQFTKWGMSISELKRVSPVKLQSGDVCPVNNKNNSSMEYRVEAASDWRVGDMNFIACYLFQNNKLKRVNLFSMKVDSEAIVKGLTQRHGSPILDSTLRRVGIITYIWDKPDEKIEFSIRRPEIVKYPYVVNYSSKEGSNETSVRNRL